MRWRSKLAMAIAPRQSIIHGHTYKNTLSEEVFDVGTVGRHVVIERQDAMHKKERSIRREWMEVAFALGFIEHADECGCSGLGR